MVKWMHQSLSRILWKLCRLKWMSNLRKRLLCRKKFMRLIGITKMWRLNFLISNCYWHKVGIRVCYVHKLKPRSWVWKKRLRRIMKKSRSFNKNWPSFQISETSRCRITLINDNLKLLSSQEFRKRRISMSFC